MLNQTFWFFNKYACKQKVIILGLYYSKLRKRNSAFFSYVLLKTYLQKLQAVKL